MAAISFKCWTPAVPFKKSDNLVSSEFSTLKIFTPSYEKSLQPHVCMEQLMANEYQRIWLMERDDWARKTFISKNGKTYIKKSSKITQKGKDDGKKRESRRKTKGDKPPSTK